jgi:hypothetical protein
MGAGGLMPDINQLTAGPYELIVFDEPAATLGLKLKPEFLKGAREGGTDGAGRRGAIEVKPATPRSRPRPQ